jgi:NADH-quinone oxidoreductase subunit F
MQQEIVFSRYYGKDGVADLSYYLKNDFGYKTLKKAIDLGPEKVLSEVKESGLRGRGGAGFPCGLKWGFIPKNSDKPKYLVINADESEPGTFKDRAIMTFTPHMMIEGAIIAAMTIDAHMIYCYIRGEYVKEAQILEKAIEEAYDAGYLGKSVCGTGYKLDMVVHRGAGAYICGEETALLNSIEGKRGEPRIKPPFFPAAIGVFGCPTVVNNVETLAAVPGIIEHGAAWFKKFGPEKNYGMKLYCISGHVNRPGLYERPMGYPLMKLINEDCGGIWRGRKLKAAFPGGSSSPVLTAAECDINLDFDSLAKAGSMLGSAGIMVIDDTTCMLRVAVRTAHFYAVESCGQCTPCREGTQWLKDLHIRLERGQGRLEDLDIIADICNNMDGTTICAFGEATAWPLRSMVKKFRSEYEQHVVEKRCPFGAGSGNHH